MMPAALRQLVARLDTAVAASPATLPAAVTGALREAVAGDDWLRAEQQRAGDSPYTRHVLYADPQDRYTIVAIAWGRGQESAIHAHHTWCGVAVYSGEVSETFYAMDCGDGMPRALRTVLRHAGTLSFDAALTGAHRIANTARDVAVSLHVYGIGAARIATGVNRVLG